MDKDLDLSALRAFRSVLREGSFAAAALALRVPKSTLSKRLADLEAQLGVRLIERSTRHLRPTREGEVLASRTDRLLEAAEDIRRVLVESGGQPKGPLRLAGPQVLGHLMMGQSAAVRSRSTAVKLAVMSETSPCHEIAASSANSGSVCSHASSARARPCEM